ncbi:MAG: penicillin-binding protein activator, partial [Xanthomonadales bacterium]|nr:penicillin-binding protein activator [Xanthomonadales bacterium]
MSPSTRPLLPPSSRLLRASLCAAIVLLAACTAPAPAPAPAAPPEVERARTAAEEGAHARAAGLYQDAAQASGDARWTVHAADQWLLAGQPERAEPLLREVDREALPRSARARHDLAWAELSLQRMDLAAAEAYLAAAASPGSPEMQARLDALQARLEALSQGPGAVALAEARHSLESMRGAAPVPALELLLQLDGLDTAALQRLEADTASDARLAAWAGLAWRARHLAVGSLDAAEAFATWGAAHPAPALSEDEFNALMFAYADAHVPSATVAVLLPGSGPLQAAGRLLRDGLLDAFLTQPGGASLRFYPTATEPASAVSAYYHALRDGADWVVGPLDRESVSAMLPVIDPATPVLLLNGPRDAVDMPRPADGTVFSLTLSPEAEARAAARRALADGHRRALALVPESAAGDRLLDPFQAEYEAGGGHLVAVARYAPGANDHSDLLTRVLDIQASQDRRRALQGTLNLPLEFEPVRRQDLDMIFLVSE